MCNTSTTHNQLSKVLKIHIIKSITFRPIKQDSKRLSIGPVGKWILSNSEVSRGDIGFLLATSFLLRATLMDSAMDTPRKFGIFEKKMKMKEIEPIKKIMEDRGSDCDA